LPAVQTDSSATALGTRAPLKLFRRRLTKRERGKASNGTIS
jgi:hypothetical protein